MAVWPGRGARPWLLATAQATDRLLVYDAGSGEPLRDFGGGGDAAGRFRRPAGIAVADDLAFVVERGNARVQVLRLPGLSTVGFVGAGELVRPSGLAVVKRGSGAYDLYVVDDSIHRYRATLTADGLASDLVATFGEGALSGAGTIGADPAAGQRLVAGAGLYPCADGSGYWVAADPADERTIFRVLDRRTLEEVGRFTGEVTANTDGVWMWSQGSEEFPQGVLYAVHDGRSVAAFGWAEVLATLSLRRCG